MANRYLPSGPSLASSCIGLFPYDGALIADITRNPPANAMILLVLTQYWFKEPPDKDQGKWPNKNNPRNTTPIINETVLNSLPSAINNPEPINNTAMEYPTKDKSGGMFVSSGIMMGLIPG